MEGDNRHYAQFLHAKMLYLSGDIAKAKDKFNRLGNLPIDPDIKNRTSDPITENGRVVEFKGKIKLSEYNFGWILRDNFGDDIYYYQQGKQTDIFKYYDKVRFNIAFNYKGLIAINLERI